MNNEESEPDIFMPRKMFSPSYFSTKKKRWSEQQLQVIHVMLVEVLPHGSDFFS